MAKFTFSYAGMMPGEVQAEGEDLVYDAEAGAWVVRDATSGIVGAFHVHELRSVTRA